MKVKKSSLNSTMQQFYRLTCAGSYTPLYRSMFTIEEYAMRKHEQIEMKMTSVATLNECLLMFSGFMPSQ